MQFTPYALPAIVALLAKAGMFFYARYSKVHNLQTKLYLLFLFCLSAQNLVEICFFLRRGEELMFSPTQIGTLYYSASILAMALLLHFASVMGSTWRGKQVNVRRSLVILLYAPALILETLLWGGSQLILGFEPMSYTYTKIPGPLYFLFQLYAFGYMCAAGGLFMYGARAHRTTVARLQNRLVLTGLLPIIAVVLVVICMQQLGIRGVSATTTLPLAITFFLVVTAYATHQYRLFDIEFFVPWSKIRKRKTMFYERIKAVIAEIADMSSVHRIVQSLSAVLHCPVVLIGGPQPVLAMAGEALGVARFPVDELKKIDRIVVANEIVEAMPATHALMKRHKVAAIVPFHPHSEAAASWMLLGEAFSEQVYSPLDFKVVENLFARLADHFLDKQLLLRSQVVDAQQEMHILHQRLAKAWEQMETLRKKIGDLQSDNRSLRSHNAELVHRQLAAMEFEGWSGDAMNQTLEEHVAEFEVRLIAEALEHCGDDDSRAAELLGVPLFTLHQKLRSARQKRGSSD
jgi:DNA-binding protein Fis